MSGTLHDAQSEDSYEQRIYLCSACIFYETDLFALASYISSVANTRVQIFIKSTT